eukprot:198715-Rhodomonas_salina.3
MRPPSLASERCSMMHVRGPWRRFGSNSLKSARKPRPAVESGLHWHQTRETATSTRAQAAAVRHRLDRGPCQCRLTDTNSAAPEPGSRVRVGLGSARQSLSHSAQACTGIYFFLFLCRRRHAPPAAVLSRRV